MSCHLLREFEAGLTPLDLSSRGYFVLAHIDRQTPPSQQDLARRLMLDPTTIVGVVDELERLGYVVRRRSADDRRRYELHLTPSGVEALAEADRALDVTEIDFFSPLSEAEQQQLHALLRTLVVDRGPDLSSPSPGRRRPG